ncbi:ETC complex I subunit [Rhodobacteraceae bacterium NNCM2]|nr:ETC complex I subunit [Coraliihabitans acroporae]
MQARIYQPSRSAMTSGQRNTRSWILEFVPSEQKRLDPLMGWSGSGDMNRQVRLRFESQEAAEEYARRHGIAYVVEMPHKRKPNLRPMGYAGNFAHNRRGNWTH